MLYSIPLPRRYRTCRVYGVLWCYCIRPKQITHLLLVTRNETYIPWPHSELTRDHFQSLCLNWNCCKHCHGLMLWKCSTPSRNINLCDTCSKAKGPPKRSQHPWKISYLNMYTNRIFWNSCITGLKPYMNRIWIEFY